MNYGMPYSGSKSKIAKQVIDFLPSGKRLCDLFGGGGAITHCALTYGSNKYESVLYNDYDPVVVEAFEKAVNGGFNLNKHEPRCITREEFNELKDTDGEVALCWSFGNNSKTYLWGADIEEIKQLAFRMITNHDVVKRYRFYRHWIKGLKAYLKDNPKSKERFDLESLERLERLQSLQSLESLELTNMSYVDYRYKNGDVVYCDIPYETTPKVNKYSHNFDFKAFYEWAWTRSYPVFFSSYEISDDRFHCETLTQRRATTSISNKKIVTEYIYMNEPAYADRNSGLLFNSEELL